MLSYHIHLEMLAQYSEFLKQSFQKRLYESALRFAILQRILFISKVRAKIFVYKLLWLFSRGYTAILDDYGTHKDFYVIIVIMFLRMGFFSLAVDLT